MVQFDFFVSYLSSVSVTNLDELTEYVCMFYKQ